MKKLLAFVAVSCLSAAFVQAQAPHTWVSGVGDDTNPGSRTAPCKTFSGVLSKTLAGGVISVLDPGGFGTVTITGPITIEGDGAQGDIVASGVNGITINAGAGDVVILRNLSLEGVGTGLAGVNIISAGAVHIENCRINAFANGINFQTSATNAQLFVKDTTIRGCSQAGINLAPSAPASALVEQVNITGCTDGLVAAAGSKAMVSDTTSSGNAGNGFLVGTNGELTLKRVTASDNQTGVQALGTAVLTDSTIADNATGLKHSGKGKILTLRNNVLAGNTATGSGTTILLPK